MKHFLRKIKTIFVMILIMGVALPTIAQSGKALNLDGVNAYMSVADATDLNIGTGQSFSFTCWVKTNSFAKRIFSKRAAPYAPANPGYEFINNSSPGGQFGVNLRATDGTNAGPAFGSTNVTDNQWHHLAMVVNTTDNTCKIYVDGGLQQTSTNAIIGSGSFASTVNLIIGANNDLSLFLAGQMDNIRVWSKALSAAEVTTDMTSTISGPTTNLIAAWDFESVTINSVPDVSGNGHTGTLNGNFAIVNVCSKVLSLDGVNSFMSVPDHADLDIAPGQTKTITCWIKTTSTNTSRIIAKRSNSSTQNPSTAGTTGTGYELWMGNGANAGKIAGNAAAWNTTTSSSTTFSTTGYNAGTANDGSWHHLAAVFDNASANKTVTFYLDAGTPNARAGTFSNTYDFSTGVAFIVGAASNNTNYFTGQMDNVRVWNTAMSQSQVAADMTNVVTGPTTNLLAAWDFENAVGTSVPDISGNGHTGTLNGNATVLTICNGMQYQATSLVQTELPAGKGDANQRIIAVDVQTTGTISPISLTSLGITMNGTTTLSDVSGVKIYYTGNSNRFNTSTLFATVTPGAGTLSANGTQTLGSGDNYFWIAYDVAAGATEGNLLDATCENITVGGNTYNFTSPNNTVAGSRTILLENQLLFAPGDAGSVSYRIPAIVTASDGSLVTVTDKRWNNTGDLPNKIDLVVRRSTDNGQTWSAPLTISNFGASSGTGDAALLVDKIKNPGTIICMFAANQGFGASTASNPIKVQYCKSTDNGITWSAPTDVTNQIYGAGCSNPYSQTWNGAFVSSGRMFQLRNGRIMAVMDVRQTSSGTQDNFTIYSDDGGTTWAALTSDPSTHGIAAAGQANEAKLVELDNGNLLMSTRHSPNQLMSVSTNAGLTWGSASSNAQLVEPSCNGDFIRFTSTVDGYNKSRLLQSIPNNSGTRKNVSVFISYDEGTTWNTSKTIYPQASAYSSLTILPDGTIGMYYENGEYGDIYDMYFVRFSLNWLTNGADTYLPSGTLPLSLLNFNGNADVPNKKVLLKWTTTNEVNVSHFEVEYSTDGKQFANAGEVKANNNSGNNEYEFVHSPGYSIPVIFYRLKTVDVDGKVAYSRVLQFRFDKVQSLTVTPNPMGSVVTVNVSVNGTAKLLVINAAGAVVKNMSVSSNSFTIDTEKFTSGLYYFKLLGADGFEKIVKVVKQ